MELFYYIYKNMSKNEQRTKYFQVQFIISCTVQFFSLVWDLRAGSGSLINIIRGKGIGSLIDIQWKKSMHCIQVGPSWSWFSVGSLDPHGADLDPSESSRGDQWAAGGLKWSQLFPCGSGASPLTLSMPYMVKKLFPVSVGKLDFFFTKKAILKSTESADGHTWSLWALLPLKSIGAWLQLLLIRAQVGQITNFIKWVNSATSHVM